MNSKICKKCKEVKDLSCFAKKLDGKKSSCRDCCAIADKRYYEKNKDVILAKAKVYNENNKREINAVKRRWNRERVRRDPVYAFASRIRTLIGNTLRRKNLSKKTKISQILCCSIEDLHSHLIQTAIKNYGYYEDDRSYHIDHIVPISVAKTEEEIIELNHYSNLQLLYPDDNLNKSNNVTWSLVVKWRKPY